MSAPAGGEDGSSPIVATVGVAIFLGFLLLATQVLVHLHAVSTASSAAADAARRAAAVGGSCDDARHHVATLIGRWHDEVTVTCHRGDADVVVRVRGTSPARLVDRAAATVGLGHIDRAVSVPIELGS